MTLKEFLIGFQYTYSQAEDEAKLASRITDDDGLRDAALEYLVALETFRRMIATRLENVKKEKA